MQGCIYSENANIFNKVLANWIQKYIIEIVFHNQVGFTLGMKEKFNIHRSVNMIYHINKMKDKNHTFIS